MRSITDELDSETLYPYSRIRMSNYSAIAIIFNPKSRGSGEANARLLQRRLIRRLDKDLVRIIPTEYAGHAEELAYELSLASPQPLIISSSGDGGYNEVINGVMRAQEAGAHPVTGLLPSGNANDHHRSVASGKIMKLILENKRRQVDLLQVMAKVDGKAWQRYAHSYVGIGLTAEIGIELNKTDLNRINEVLIAIRTIYNSRAATILIDGEEQNYDSLVFSNVGRMGKMQWLAKDSRVDDGKFEIHAFHGRNKVKMLEVLAKTITSNVTDVPHAASFSFQTVKSLAIQLDGEVFTLDAKSNVAVKSLQRVLTCII